MKISTVFLDRDGVLNENCDPSQRSAKTLKVYPFVPAAIRKLKCAGMDCIIISNQSGVGRGYYTPDENRKMFEKVINIASSEGGSIKAYYYCPHLPEDNCVCRKPKTALLDQAILDHSVKRNESIYIGDSMSDFRMARNGKIPFILVRTGHGRETEKLIKSEKPDSIICDDLSEAVEIILRRYV